jgi:Tol biopolymer transport system component
LGAIDVINADGSGRKELTANANDPPQLAWSPDGKRIAFVDHSEELSVIDADGSGLRRLTNTPGRSFVASPTWSPDSEKIAYSCPFEGLNWHTDLCVINADGTGMKRIASKVAPAGSEVATSWARE